MSPHSWNRPLPTLLFGASVLLLALASPPSLLAQRELPPKRPIAGDRIRPAAGDLTVATPLVVRGSGGPGEERPADDMGEPADLSPDQQSQMVASLGLSLWHGNGPWKVTPGAPVAGGRAYLGFREAEHVGVGSGEYPASARIHGRSSYGPAGYVSLTIRASAPGERYLVDCKVSPTGSRGLRFSGPGTSTTFTNTEHLIAIYEAMDTEPASFRIEVPPIETSSNWTFYSCEITALQ